MVEHALHDEDASHILVMPFLVVALIWVNRRSVFRTISGDCVLGTPLLTVGLTVMAATQHFKSSLSESDSLAGTMLGLVLVWIAGFALIFGRTAARRARFGLLLLFLTVPLPSIVLHKSVELLQAGSAQITAMIFDLLDVPYVREGFVFNLRQVSIEVTEECSGLRSSFAVLILALIAGHLYLRTLPSKVAFIAASLSVMVIKNGIRIATLTLLSIYVSPSFLSGRLHHQGGVVFFLLGLGILAPVLLVLRRLESKGTESKGGRTLSVPDVLAEPSRTD